MIFIPSIGGISHSPKEFSRPQDIENGANVLLQTMLAFDEREDLPRRHGDTDENQAYEWTVSNCAHPR